MRFFKRHLTPAFLAAVLLFTFSPLIPTARAVYADAENTWAAEIIEKAGAYGLMEGYPDGRFAPRAVYSRQQACLTIWRLHQAA